MKNKTIKLFAIIACVAMLAALAVGLIACNPKVSQPQVQDGTYYLSLKSQNWATYNDESAIPDSVKFVKEQGKDHSYAVSVELDADDEFVIRKIGSEEKYGYDILFTALNWLSDGSDNIKVNAKGIYNLKLATTDGIILTYTFTSTEAPPPEETGVTGVEVDPDSVMLDIGETASLSATVLPETASNKQVLWVSDNTGVATVDQNGLVTAVAPGVTNVTVNTLSGGYSAECVVTVRQPVTRIALDVDSITLVAKGNAKSVAVRISPSDATNKNFSYELTSGENLVSVSKPDNTTLSLSGLAVGNATLVVKSDDNAEITATLNITVLEEGSILADMQANVQIALDGTAELVPHLDGANIVSVEWGISNESVASLTENKDRNTATVKGLNFGTSIVTAIIHADNGNTYQITSNVLVAEPYYFIYGVGFGTVDWEFEPYIASEQAAKDANLLLEEESRGVYSLTRKLVPSNGFQIIFPNVNSFKDEDTTKWNKNIPSDLVDVSHYYDSIHSDTEYVDNVNTQFKVNAAGIYKITLDLTGTSAKVNIKMVSLEASSIGFKVEGASNVLKYGSNMVVDISYLPTTAAVTEQEVKVYLTSDYANFENYASVAFDFASKKATLSLKSDVTEEFVVTLHCEIQDAAGVLEIPVLPSTVEETPVDSIAFEKEHYYVNVNNAGLKWEQIVKATVNESATNQQVRYTDITNYTRLGKTLAAGLRPTVDPDSGLVTALVLGTITIEATALGDPSKTDICEVTFYSDGLYLIGKNYGGWDNALEPTTTSLEGTAFEGYAFTKLSETHYQYAITINNVDDNDEGFSIAFLGMDTDWVSAIRTANRLDEFSTARFGGWSNGVDYANARDSKNTAFRKAGTYILDVDLSKPMALWTINYADSNLTQMYLEYDEAKTALKENESMQLKLSYFPQYIEVQESEIKYSMDGSDKTYLDVNFDFATKTFTITASTVEFSEDVPLTLTVTVKDISQTIEFTAVAKHHLEWASDNNNHWQQCIDDDCGYETSHETHQVDKDKWAYDESGHYHECSVCGGSKVDNEVHSFILDEDGYYSKGLTKCPDCGYVIYEMTYDYSADTATITKYNGAFEKIKLPNEIGGCRLTTIAANAFADNKYLKQIVISENITTIEKNAFAGCIVLQEIKLPSSVKSVGNYVFDGCVELRSADLSAMQATSLGKGMFRNCSALNSVKLPAMLESISEYCFMDCTALDGSDISIPNSVKVIGSSAFSGCSSLKNIGLPTSLLTISNAAFKNCVLLDGITFPNGLLTIDIGAFIGCEALKTLDIPQSVTTIGSQAFNNCYALINADIKADITIISNIFSNCTSLEKVVFHSKSLGVIHENNFVGCNRLAEVYMYLGPLFVKYKYTDYDDSGSSNNDRMFKSANGIKHAYFYSYTRLTDDAFLGPFAGVWHYDAEGNIQLWADTPIGPNDYDPACDMKVHIDFVAEGPTYGHVPNDDTPTVGDMRTDQIMFSGDGIINPNGALSVTLNWKITHQYGNGDPTFGFKISVDGPAISYNANYVYSTIQFDLKDRWSNEKNRCPIWFSDSWIPSAQYDYYEHTYAFTFTFDNEGLLLKVAVHEVTE